MEQHENPEGPLLGWGVGFGALTFLALVFIAHGWLDVRKPMHWGALATVGLLLVTVRYTIIAQAQWREAAVANRLTRTFHSVSLRPWVMVKTVQTPGWPENGSPTVTVQNYGQSPAIGAKLTVSWRPINARSGEPLERNFESKETEMEFSLPPGETVALESEHSVVNHLSHSFARAEVSGRIDYQGPDGVKGATEYRCLFHPNHAPNPPCEGPGNTVS